MLFRLVRIAIAPEAGPIVIRRMKARHAAHWRRGAPDTAAQPFSAAVTAPSSCSLRQVAFPPFCGSNSPPVMVAVK
jgi:hypothetical protein